MSARFLMIAGIVSLALASQAMGQLIWSDDYYSILQNNGVGEFTVISTPSPTSTDEGFIVNGDLVITADESEVARYTWLFQRGFTVGPLPVQISPEFRREFKIAVGGGSPQAPDAAIDMLNFTVYDLDASVLVVSDWDSYYNQFGNGWSVFSENVVYPSYVLSPGVSYHLGISAVCFLSSQPEGSPIATGTFEFGGITTFAGFEADLNPQIVPEPGMLVLLAVGGLGALLRRRR